MNLTKTCIHCGESKLTTDFYKQKCAKDGLRPNCKVCSDKRTTAYQKTEEGKLSNRKSALKRKYGLTLDAFSDLWKEHSGCCAMCNRELFLELGNRSYAIDHNHTTGHVRGILCMPCNTALGLLQDNPAILRRGAEYLEENTHYGKQGRQSTSCEEATA